MIPTNFTAMIHDSWFRFHPRTSNFYPPNLQVLGRFRERSINTTHYCCITKGKVRFDALTTATFEEDIFILLFILLCSSRLANRERTGCYCLGLFSESVGREREGGVAWGTVWAALRRGHNGHDLKGGFKSQFILFRSIFGISLVRKQSFYLSPF